MPASAEEEFNIAYGVRRTLGQLQQLLGSGKQRVHRRRAALFGEAIEAWQCRVPEGGPVQLLELSRLKPRKDRRSHPGDTGRYSARAILRMLRRLKPRTDGGLRRASRSWPTGAPTRADLCPAGLEGMVL